MVHLFTPSRVPPHRGFISSDGLWHLTLQLFGPLNAETIPPPSLGAPRDLLRNSPRKRTQLPGNRDHDLMRVFPPCAELPIALAQADLGLPAHVLERLGELFEAEVEVPTPFGGVAIRPGPFHQRTTGIGIAGLGAAALASACATGRFRRRQAQIMHELSGVLAARQVAECGDGDDRHCQLHATEGLQRVNHRAAPPGGDLLVAFLGQPLQPCGVFGDGPDIVLENHVLGGSGTDPLAQPPQGRRAPGGSACIPDILPQEQGFEAQLGRLEVVERLFTRAAEVTNSFGVDRWDINRGEVPRAYQARQWDGIPTIRFDTVAGLFREQGGGDDPATVAFCGQRAIEPIATGADFIDQDALLACGLQLPDERVDITLPRPDRAQGDDFRAIFLGDVSDCDGLFMDIHSDVERARL